MDALVALRSAVRAALSNFSAGDLVLVAVSRSEEHTSELQSH